MKYDATESAGGRCVCAVRGGADRSDAMQYFDIKISKQSKGKRPSHLMRKRQQMAAVLARVDTKVCDRARAAYSRRHTRLPLQVREANVQPDADAEDELAK